MCTIGITPARRCQLKSADDFYESETHLKLGDPAVLKGVYPPWWVPPLARLAEWTRPRRGATLIFRDTRHCLHGTFESSIPGHFFGE